MTHGSPDPSADSELTLHEMLADPIFQTVMARSGVTKEDMESLFGVAREKTAVRQARGPEASRQELGAVNGDG